MPAVALSSAATFPNTELAFRLAAEAGFDGVELMVTHDRRSQDVASVEAMVALYEVPVTSVHVPCLFLSQHVWGWEPASKLKRSVEVATELGADVVVVHPPFRWQRYPGGGFHETVVELTSESLKVGGPVVAVENMFGFGAMGRRVEPYAGGAEDDLLRFDHLTLDTSHVAVDRADVLEVHTRFGARVRHLHLSDSTATGGDEHLPVGRGSLPLAELGEAMVDAGFDGHVVLEIGLSRMAEEERLEAASTSLAFAREHWRIAPVRAPSRPAAG